MLDKYLPYTDKWRILAATVPVSLSCGTLFVYSVYGTQLANKCGLDSSLAANLNISATVGTSVAGLLGGVITDRYGTQIPVLFSLVSITFGYMWLHSLYLAGTAAYTWELVAAMFFVGLGSTSSYFAAIKAVTVSFPKYKGSAQSVTIASFAILSLIYSYIYSSVFHGSVSKFLFFLSVSSAAMQFVGVLFIRVDGHKTDKSAQQELELMELLPLMLSSSSYANLEALNERKTVVSPLQTLNIRQTLSHPVFWFHFVVMALTQGIGQMYIYSVGFVVKAIHYEYAHDPSQSDIPSLHSVQALHVSLIAIFSFLGRLASGPMADSIVHRHHGQRQWVTVFGVAIMTIGQFCVSLPIDSWSSNLTSANVLLSVVSSIIGFAYGLTFTTFPGIVADLFSLKNYSVVWGVLYSSTVPGLTLFTKVFGYIYDKNSKVVDDDYICAIGSACYTATFDITSGLCVVVLASLLIYIYVRRTV